MESSFEHVTKEKPCAICGHSDWCCRLTRYHLCMRVKSDKPTQRTGWLHAKDAASQNLPIPPRPHRKSDDELHKEWAPIAAKAHRSGRHRLGDLASMLGVDPGALDRLGVGYTELQGQWCWTFPERNAIGQVVGITKRLEVPTAGGKTKLFAKGARRGLTYCDTWCDYSGVIWLVEGGSDVAAALTLGLCVIGRPSNTGGIDMLVRLLAAHPKRRIVVLGENDRKSALHVMQSNPRHDPKCKCCLSCWPGKAGAIQTAVTLANRLGTPVGRAMPPVGVKDLREYVKALEPGAWHIAADKMRRGAF